MVDRTPPCFRCNAQLAIKRVNQLSGGFEARTFQCQQCDHHLVVVASSSDPMDSMENRLIAR
jgi:hypothetical protein